MKNDYIFMLMLLIFIVAILFVIISLYVILRRNSYKNYNSNKEVCYTESVLYYFISGNEEKELSLMIKYHQDNIANVVDYEIG